MENIITIQHPQQEELKEFIAYYYFMRSESPDGKVNFNYYPHYHTALNFFSNSIVDLEQNKFRVIQDTTSDTAIVVSCGRNSFKKATVLGAYDIVGVIFKPLAIFHFLDVFAHNPNSKPEYLLVSSMIGINDEMRDELFNEELMTNRVKFLDDFFCRHQRPFQMPILQAVVATILESNGAVKVQELEDQYKVSRRTLLRWFKKYLFCSISDFKNVVRFRTAIDSYKLSRKKLGALSYESNFYDQSDFINHFKSLTGELPKQLLEYVNNQSENALFWKFENI